MERIKIDDVNGYIRWHSEDPLNPITEDKEWRMSLLVHDICRGFLDDKDISETHCAIVCRSCKLRIPIPRKIKTFRELRIFLSERA